MDLIDVNFRIQVLFGIFLIIFLLMWIAFEQPKRRDQKRGKA